MLVPLKPHMWLRFTDDIDIQWRQSRKDLHEFLDKANAFHKTIKFTSEISNENHTFWNTERSQLVTDLYWKPKVTSFCTQQVAIYATVPRAYTTVLFWEQEAYVLKRLTMKDA